MHDNDTGIGMSRFAIIGCLFGLTCLLRAGAVLFVGVFSRDARLVGWTWALFRGLALTALMNIEVNMSSRNVHSTAHMRVLL